MTTPSIRDQLTALDRPASKQLLRRLTLLDVRCRSCGVAVFSVVATRPDWVVRFRGTNVERAPQTDYRLSNRYETKLFVRLDRNARQNERLLHGVCRCRTQTITEAWLWEQLDAHNGAAGQVVTLHGGSRQ